MTAPNKSPSLQEFRERNVHSETGLEKHPGEILIMKVYSEDLWYFSMCSISMVGSEDICLHKQHVLHSDTPHVPFVLHKEDHPKSETNLKKLISGNTNGKNVEKNSQIGMLGKNIYNLREHGAPQTRRGKCGD